MLTDEFAAEAEYVRSHLRLPTANTHTSNGFKLGDEERNPISTQPSSHITRIMQWIHRQTMTSSHLWPMRPMNGMTSSSNRRQVNETRDTEEIGADGHGEEEEERPNPCITSFTHHCRQLFVRCCCYLCHRCRTSAASTTDGPDYSALNSCDMNREEGMEGLVSTQPITHSEPNSIELESIRSGVTLNRSHPSSTAAASAAPTLASLPILASVEKQKHGVTTISAPQHEIANKELFIRPTPASTTPNATNQDQQLLIPLDAQRRLELELKDFYHDFDQADDHNGDRTDLHPSDDDITEDDDDDDDLDLSLSDDDDRDPFLSDPLRTPIRHHHDRRSLDETPAARRKREANRRARKKLLADQIRADQLEQIEAEQSKLELVQATILEQAKIDPVITPTQTESTASIESITTETASETMNQPAPLLSSSLDTVSPPNPPTHPMTASVTSNHDQTTLESQPYEDEEMIVHHAIDTNPTSSDQLDHSHLSPPTNLHLALNDSARKDFANDITVKMDERESKIR